MKRLIVTENITLDGVIDAGEQWFAPSGEAGDEADLEAAIREQSVAADGLLVGRVTFEELRGYWPHQEDDTTGVREYLNRVEKYVISSTLEDPGWEHTTVIDGEPLEKIEELKRSGDADLVCTGSITLARALITAGLVDEYRLFTYPVVIGRGARLFEDEELGRLRLLESNAFRNGAVLSRYASG